MKKFLFFATALLGLAACSSENLVEEPEQGKDLNNVPITIQTQKDNITRATNLENTGHYNFGVWAQKIASGKTTQKVMENYLVGYGGATGGYDHAGATTWGNSTSDTDHKSLWFYEGLGTSQYHGSGAYYTPAQTEYMSANAEQFLRYWDLAYTYTNFYCYTPYRNSGVTATLNADGSASITFANTALSDGYDYTPNSAYANKGRSLSEFMYAGVQARNADLKDITIPFKHMGAQVFICFYEDIPGYKVEVIDLDADGATMAAGASADQKKGVQATPSVKGSTYSLGQYYTSSEATVSFSTAAVPSFDAAFTGATQVSENLMFYAPSNTSSVYVSSNVPSGYAANLSTLSGAQDGLTHYTIPESGAAGSGQQYAWSPTIYYPVAQPTTQKTGFTFHVSFRIIADDNKEVTTVHNATVHVPYTVTTWASNTRYIYRFKITKDSTGSTNPGGPSGGYDPQNPTPDSDQSLYPIVFDGATIEDYTVNETEHVIGSNT